MHSPEDHAVLEAAYQRNSKPDKSERTAIVNRVGLGEKEVSVRQKRHGCVLWTKADREPADMVPKQTTERSAKVETPAAP